MNKSTILTPRIIRSWRKTIALIIEPDGSLIVRAPLKLSKKRIDEIIQEKADWIHTRQAEFLRQRSLTAHHQYRAGEEFWYLGEKYSLELTRGQAAPLVFTSHFLLDQDYQDRGAQIFEAWYRLQARRIIMERTQSSANQLGVHFNRFRLSSAGTRWGSCSSRGTISLVWRLIMAPIPVIDYVILHELIHLRVPNHSKDFWSQVQAIMPEYCNLKQWLKKNGAQLRL